MGMGRTERDYDPRTCPHGQSGYQNKNREAERTTRTAIKISIFVVLLKYLIDLCFYIIVQNVAYLTSCEVMRLFQSNAFTSQQISNTEKFFKSHAVCFLSDDSDNVEEESEDGESPSGEEDDEGQLDGEDDDEEEEDGNEEEDGRSTVYNLC